jgi:hypothetical protein
LPCKTETEALLRSRISLSGINGDVGDVIVFEILDQIDGEKLLPTPPLPLMTALNYFCISVTVLFN